jgi:hypothetical protein
VHVSCLVDVHGLCGTISSYVQANVDFGIPFGNAKCLLHMAKNNIDVPLVHATDYIVIYKNDHLDD